MATETPAPPRTTDPDDTRVTPAAPREVQEVDLTGVMRAIARFWWIVVLAVVIGAMVAFGTSRGSTATYQASAVVYAGQPVGPNGQLLNTVTAKAATVIEVARGDDAIKAGADAAGVSPNRIRTGLAVTAITSPLASKLQNPPALVRVTMRDRSQKVSQKGAAAVAAQVVKDTNTYTPGKVKALGEAVDAYKASMKLLDTQRAQALDAARSATGSEAASFAILATSLSRETEQTRADLASAQGALGLASELETSRIITAPNAVKVSSKASRSNAVMGALVGLLAGLLVAWLVGRRRTA